MATWVWTILVANSGRRVKEQSRIRLFDQAYPCTEHSAIYLRYLTELVAAADVLLTCGQIALPGMRQPEDSSGPAHVPHVFFFLFSRARP